MVDVLAGVEPAALAAALSLLSPAHPLVCAARLGLDIGEARHVRHAGLPRGRKNEPRTACCWASWLGEWARTPRRRLDPHPVPGRLITCDHVGDLTGICDDCWRIWTNSLAEMRGAA